MTRAPFPISWKDLFIETAFERRFQAMLRSAWQKRTWHVLVADPTGSGRVVMDHLMKLVSTALEWSRSGQEKRMSQQRR
jgi:hypothetical protein